MQNHKIALHITFQRLPPLWNNLYSLHHSVTLSVSDSHQKPSAKCLCVCLWGCACMCVPHCHTALSLLYLNFLFSVFVHFCIIWQLFSFCQVGIMIIFNAKSAEENWKIVFRKPIMLFFRFVNFPSPDFKHNFHFPQGVFRVLGAPPLCIGLTGTSESSALSLFLLQQVKTKAELPKVPKSKGAITSSVSLCHWLAAAEMKIRWEVFALSCGPSLTHMKSHRAGMSRGAAATARIS